jgi:hypothetical protein
LDAGHLIHRLEYEITNSPLAAKTLRSFPIPEDNAFPVPHNGVLYRMILVDSIDLTQTSRIGSGSSV